MVTVGRPQTPSERHTEQRAYDATMRVFARYNVDPRMDTHEAIGRAMNRMTIKELELVATAQRLVMALNGIHGGIRLDGQGG